MVNFIEEIFSATVTSYKSILSCYYPAHRSNGFTERNLTFNFSYNYLLKNEEAIIWQESPLEDGKHFDTLIIDDKRKTIIIVEAKRLQNENKSIQIAKDFEKINTHFGEIKLEDQRKTYSKYGLLLIDIWISKTKNDNDKRAKLLDKLNLDLQSGNNIFSKRGVDIDYTSYKEKYYLAYKLFPVDK